MAVRAIRMPAVFVRSEGDPMHASREISLALPLSIDKLDLDSMRALRVLIHQHDGPLPVRPFQDVSGHEQVSEGVARIARSPKNTVHSVYGLRPLSSDQLSSEVTGVVVRNIEIAIDKK